MEEYFERSFSPSQQLPKMKKKIIMVWLSFLNHSERQEKQSPEIIRKKQRAQKVLRWTACKEEFCSESHPH